jgi:hypothetical protein
VVLRFPVAALFFKILDLFLLVIALASEMVDLGLILIIVIESNVELFFETTSAVLNVVEFILGLVVLNGNFVKFVFH